MNIMEDVARKINKLTMNFYLILLIFFAMNAEILEEAILRWKIQMELFVIAC